MQVFGFKVGNRTSLIHQEISEKQYSENCFDAAIQRALTNEMDAPGKECRGCAPLTKAVVIY